MVKIDLAQAHHFSAIVNLIQQEEPHFTWETFQQKYLRHAQNILLVAHKGDKIVGFIGGLFSQLRNNDVIYWAVDAVVDAQHRKQGIATQLLKSLIFYGKYVIGIGVKNAHILKAEINAGFKVSRHIHTYTSYPVLPQRLTLQPVSLQEVKSFILHTAWQKNTHDIDWYFQNTVSYEIMKDTSLQTFVVLKKEPFGLRLMECSQDKNYFSMVVKAVRHYHQKVRFLVNRRQSSFIQAMYKALALPAFKPEILIYTHDFMLDLPIYFGHSDWFAY